MDFPSSRAYLLIKIGGVQTVYHPLDGLLIMDANVASPGSDLPAELWLQIFRMVTTASTTYKLYNIDYSPFYDPPIENNKHELQAVRRMKRFLVLVCRYWQTLARKFLYEDLRVGHGARGLLKSLERSAKELGEGGYGRWTRRVETYLVEYDSEDSTNPVTPLDILKWCPNVEILVKCDDDLHPHKLNDAVCTSIQRFDWCYAQYSDGIHGFQPHNDDESKGLDFLVDVIHRSSNLRRLSLEAYFSSIHPIANTVRSLTLPSLTTLRVVEIDLGLRMEMNSWMLPRLTHLITDNCLLTWRKQPVWSSSITTLEIVAGATFFYNNSIIDLLAYCPNVAELNYYIQHVSAPVDESFLHLPLRTIGLHTSPNLMLLYVSTRSLHTNVMEHIEDHFRMFAGPMFPSLARVVLYDDWRSIVSDSRFHPFPRQLIDRGCQLVYADGSIVTVP